MKRIKFDKMVASGNDFIVIVSSGISGVGLKKLAQRACDRKYGIGADGLLVLEKSGRADIRMRIFNADGSEAEMCGNGARCVAAWVNSRSRRRASKASIETKAGIIESLVDNGSVRIRLTVPRDLSLNLPVMINDRLLRVNFINTGVPHAVIFVEGLDKIDVATLGREVRYHKAFTPRGTNVDFVEVASGGSIRVRTYERGVEAETLACGTGSVASALIFALKGSLSSGSVKVGTESGEVLKVYFKRVSGEFKDIWLEGQARIVYRGEYYV